VLAMSLYLLFTLRIRSQGGERIPAKKCLYMAGGIELDEKTANNRIQSRCSPTAPVHLRKGDGLLRSVRASMSVLSEAEDRKVIGTGLRVEGGS
jgi:hypothetical protein